MRRPILLALGVLLLLGVAPVRAEAHLATLAAGVQTSGAAPDLLEDNYDPAHASPVAVGVTYDLTLVCPAQWPGACPGGDHDFLRAPVKAGTTYLIAAYELGPGTDPVVTLFWGDETRPAGASDDVLPGGFASALRWRAPADGSLLILVAPRNGGIVPVVPDPDARRYRFAVVLAGSAQAAAIEASIARDAGERASDATGHSSPPAPGAATQVSGDAPGGPAMVIAERTALREQPNADAAAIQTLEQGAAVTLLGSASGSWVRARPNEGVTPGWIYGPDLRPDGIEPAASTEPAATPAPGPPVVDPAPMPAAAQAPATTAHEQHTVLRAVPLGEQRQPVRTVSRETVSVSVTLRATGGRSPPQRGSAPPREADEGRPLAGMRVQLLNVLGELLGETVTGAEGSAVLTRDVSPGAALRIAVPALGADIPVDRASPQIRIVVSEGAEP